MVNKTCTVCKKKFTRQWNLERHLKDIHEIYQSRDNDMVKQRSDPYSYPFSRKKGYFRNSENNMGEINNYQNPPEYNNFPIEFSTYDIHNHGFYENFEPFPIKKEKNLTIGDMIRIRDGLQILRNFLQRIYPNYIVVQQICWLHYRCYTQKSIQPLRDFYIKNNLISLWPRY